MKIESAEGSAALMDVMMTGDQKRSIDEISAGDSARRSKDNARWINASSSMLMAALSSLTLSRRPGRCIQSVHSDGALGVFASN